METAHSLANASEEEIRELWSRTYNREGRPDWSHIFPYYAEDIVFRDSIQEIRGFDEFKAMCQRLTSRCKQLRMRLPEVVKVVVFYVVMKETTIVEPDDGDVIVGSTHACGFYVQVTCQVSELWEKPPMKSRAEPFKKIFWLVSAQVFS